MRPTTLAELDQARQRCQKLVSRRALVSAAAAVVPIPGVDVRTDVAILLQLIPGINAEFGLSPGQLHELNPELAWACWVKSSPHNLLFRYCNV